MKKLLLLLLLASAGCSSKAPVWRITVGYEMNQLPQWVIDEWHNAQDELLRLPNIPQDPRRFSPDEWEWVHLQGPFWVDWTEDGDRIKVRGTTRFDAKEILICCGDRETVRHEAFHAILWKMGDSRYERHYPELRKELK